MEFIKLKDGYVNNIPAYVFRKRNEWIIWWEIGDFIIGVDITPRQYPNFSLYVMKAEDVDKYKEPILRNGFKLVAAK